MAAGDRRDPPVPPPRGERTRDEAEVAELARLTGRPYVPAGGDDELDAMLGDEATAADEPG